MIDNYIMHVVYTINHIKHRVRLINVFEIVDFILIIYLWTSIKLKHYTHVSSIS